MLETWNGFQTVLLPILRISFVDSIDKKMFAIFFGKYFLMDAL